MEILDGKIIAEKIKENCINELKNLEKKPNIAIFSLKEDSSRDCYIKSIRRNCEKYGIDLTIISNKNEEEFKRNFKNILNDKKITGIMFAEPISKECKNLLEEIPENMDIEGVTSKNMGKLFINGDCNYIPCTSKAVIEILDYYKINLQGKKVAIVGRSNIVGKPLIPQLLNRNATVTICHSKTEEIQEELKKYDIIIMAIGKANFLKKEMIKENAILIDVGINVLENKIVGDIDFESVKEKAKCITKVPGGVGTVTNAILISNMVKSAQKN